MKRRTTVMIALLAFVLGAGIANAQLFRQLLTVGGAVLVADQLGPQIDSAINGITGQRNLDHQEAATKIVPILSVGEGAFVGIVQVAGPKESVDTVRAVAQLEGRVPLIGGSRAKVMVPINVRTVTNMRRVSGVGISAIIDLRL